MLMINLLKIFKVKYLFIVLVLFYLILVLLLLAIVVFYEVFYKGVELFI